MTGWQRLAVEASVAFLAGFFTGGCEAEDSSAADGRLLARHVLADGSVRTVYEENVTTEAGKPAIRRITITQPAVGEPTTSVVVTVMSSSIHADTNAIPANGAAPPQSPMPHFPGLPPDAVPLPPAP